MNEPRYFMVRIRRTAGLSPYMTLNEVASHCGVHPELIRRFVCLGLIDPVDRTENDEPLFDVDVMSLVRKIIRLRNHLGINYAGIGVVLELMTRIEALEAQVRELESTLLRSP